MWSWLCDSGSDCVLFIFPTLDESVEEAGAEGDYIEQEDQGQGHFANQGKPSLDHTLLS